ncbi:MAG: leucine--tRNA ligase [Candidatus Adlerbacteria bacterium]|nr:leucine--tRNA ligase [Candidatus Adlerbacteria bacterium]
MEGYDHTEIEKKWQARWKDADLYKTPDAVEGKENYYFLTEFPYPSGNLHVGHWYAFSVPDIFARYMRMRGYNVMYPIGFDAFGLPAENAAIQRGLNPRDWTFSNMEYMRNQLLSMGASFDWSREVITCTPEYYKWTQWLFIQLYNKGLVYRRETSANWCPKDKTVLANEQVVNGHCERCGSPVEKRMMPQWNIKITDYADRLIDDLAGLDWPKQIKDAQINWIGRSEGAEINFALTFTYKPEANDNRGPNGEKAQLSVFTTRPDTLFGATYLVLAPEHLWVTLATDDNHDVLENKDEVRAYIAAASKKSELERKENKEKTGVEVKGVVAINPANGQEIPIYVADYVLGGYGTGAIMAVPAHDERDFEFATKFNLPIVQVIEPTYYQTTEPGKIKEGEPFDHREAIIAIVKHWSEDKYMALKWKKVAWGTFITGGIEEGQTPEQAAQMEIEQETGYLHARPVKNFGVVHGKFYHVPKKTNRNAHAHVVYLELEDDEQKPVADEEKDMHELLWLTADELQKFLTPDTHIYGLKMLLGTAGIYTDAGTLANSGQFTRLESEEAQAKIVEFVGGKITKQYQLRDWGVSRQRYWGVPIPMVHCENCEYVPVGDEQLPVVLPEISDYLPTGDGKSPLAKATDWVNTTCPKCGGPAVRETDTLDTFVDSSWYFLRYADPKNTAEFASKEKLENWLPVDLYSGGSEHTTMHVLYSRFWHKAMFDMGLVNTPEPYLKRMNRGLIMGPDGQKMSKSKGNVIDPDEIVRQLGADTVRMYLAFIGPYNEVGAYPWNPGGTVGVRRFLERVIKLKVGGNEPLDSKTDAVLHQTIKKVGDDIGTLKLNTCVAALMTLLNTFEKLDTVPHDAYSTFVQLLAPFAPHLSDELWEKLGNDSSVHLVAWPQFDPAKLVADTVIVGVQINGKARGTVELAAGVTQEEALAAARSNENVAKWLEGKVEKRAVYVPGRIINIVVD